MKTKFRYNYDRRVKWISVITLSIIAIAIITLYLIDTSIYIHAWILSVIIAIIALCTLSIPRFISVNDQALEIHCVAELTRIDIRDIAIIRRVDREEYRGKVFLALGSYGFFGYYGYYFNFSEWEFIKVYATERANYVEIEDIYEQKYLVSCRERDELIEAVMQAKLHHN